MAQHVLEKGKLLDTYGELDEAGYAKSLVKEYSRKDIKGMKTRIKEWDYYYIGNSRYGVALTVADNSYMSLASVSILDFEKKSYITKSYMGFFSFGKINLPPSSENGDVVFKSKKFSMRFLNSNGERHLICKMKNLKDDKTFECNISLQLTNEDSMVIATPFKKRKHFYYNQKINLLKASGSFSFDGKTYPLDDAYGVLDWGRGVLTYKNTWYWSSLSGVCNSRRVGFNLGYGFGDTSQASENMLFVDDVAYKLDDVTFYIPKDEKGNDDFMKEWKIESKDKRINLTFTPILDRKDDTNVIILRSNQHQVFGKFNGYILNGEDKVEFIDMVGFAEKVFNKW